MEAQEADVEFFVFFSCRVGDHGYVEDLCFPRCVRPGHLPDVLLTSRACQVRHTEIAFYTSHC